MELGYSIDELIVLHDMAKLESGPEFVIVTAFLEGLIEGLIDVEFDVTV